MISSMYMKKRQNNLGDEQKDNLNKLSSIFKDLAQQKLNPVSNQSEASARNDAFAPPSLASPRVISPNTALYSESQNEAPDDGPLEPWSETVGEEQQIVKTGPQTMPQRIQQELDALNSTADYNHDPPTSNMRSQ